MATYEITLDSKHEENLKTVSEKSGISVEEILSDFLNTKLEEGMVDLAVQQYKNGNLTAMKAWKISGLSFDEFNALAKE